MKKRFIFPILISIILFAPFLTFAHVLQTDGEIGAVLHVEPDDDPIAGQLATFEFELKDKANRFKPQDCNCQAVILSNSQPIFQTQIFNSINDIQAQPSFQFIFGQAGVYQVSLSGKAKAAGAFQDFVLKL